VVFLALHGGAGEDGTHFKPCSTCGLPNRSNHVASAAAMDKDLSSDCSLRGVPTPDWLMAPAAGESENVGAALVGPWCQAQQNRIDVGLTVVREAVQLPVAIERRQRFDDESCWSAFMPGANSPWACWTALLCVGEINLRQGEVFDYESKYQQAARRRSVSADIRAPESELLQD